MTPTPDLSELRIAVDVQHLYRASHAGDQGAVFTLPDGTHVTEAHAATQYAAALVSSLRDAGAKVLTNDAAAGVLVGEYWTRNRRAAAWNAHAYLACHVNAGGGRYACAKRMTSAWVPPHWSVMASDMAGSILASLARKFPDRIAGGSCYALNRGERGAVCIQAFAGPALVLEPFFGDTGSHQTLLSSGGLRDIGNAIAAGVAAWWASPPRPSSSIPR